MEGTNLAHIFKDVYAVIWDMDGVLIDSESYHFAAHKQALAEVGVPLTKEFYIEHGLAVDVKQFYARAFAEANVHFDDAVFENVFTRKLALYNDLQHEQGIKHFPLARSIVEKLYNKGMLMAIASQVDRAEVVRNLRGTNILEYFPIIVFGGDFGLRKKPAPDMYLKAVEMLNVKPESCIAIEDSSIGARSAVAAGLTCLVVTNEFTKTQQFPKEVIRTSFEAILDAI